jgi:ubiquinone/menaquinone biosynthesis C-methylase UbiE
MLERQLDLPKTRKMYGRVAWFYDTWSWFTESKAANRVIELAEIQDGSTILEVACGTGIVFEKILARNPAGKTTGIDLTPAMLEKARRKLEKKGYSNFDLREGNALDLPFNNETFDRVFNCYMIDLLPEDRFDQVAAEFFRVLKPGGLALVSIFSEGSRQVNKPWHWIAEYLPDLLTGCRPTAFRKNLERAGFTIEASEELSQNTFPSEVIRARKPVII